MPINAQHMLFPLSTFQVLQRELNESYLMVDDHSMGTKTRHMVSIWTTYSSLLNLCLILAYIHMKLSPLSGHCGGINSKIVVSIKIRIFYHITFGWF